MSPEGHLEKRKSEEIVRPRLSYQRDKRSENADTRNRKWHCKS